ncbi:hypothetical protein DWB58_28170 [candidate division KSB1 bacterium]|nr:hypothetical protein [candidate division KSB1 bacterium]
MVLLLSPDLIIIGGGAAKDYQKFAKYIELPVEMIPAQNGNLAGIVGAALAGQNVSKKTRAKK